MICPVCTHLSDSLLWYLEPVGTDSANLKVRQYHGVTTEVLKSINIWIEDTNSYYCLQYEKKSSMCSHALRNFVSLTHCEETTTIIIHSAENLVDLNKINFSKWCVYWGL